MDDYMLPRLLKKQVRFIEVASAAALTLTVLVCASYLITTVYTYRVLIPRLDFSPQVYYTEDQLVIPLGSAVLDVYGAVASYTVGSNTTAGGILVVSAGDAVEITTNPDNFTVGLKNRPGVAGTVSCATVGVTSEGVTISAASGIPAPASSSTFGAGTVQQALESPFLTLSSEAELTGSRQLVHDAARFNAILGSGTLEIEIVPSATANQNCTHIQSITFASGVRVSSCVSGSAPGTANGPATLGMDGRIPLSQLPVVFNSEYRGLWDADADDPSLTCSLGANYYLFVNVGGNTTKGSFNSWESKDVIFCNNGTFGQITGIPVGVHTFNGRFNNVTAQLGDYTDSMIPFSSGTLANVVNAPLVGTAASSVFTNIKVLNGTPGEISVSGATIGLVDVPFWNGTTTTLIGALRDVVLEESGRFVSASVGPIPVQRVLSTPDQVDVLNNLLVPVASATGNVSIRLQQTTSPSGGVQFNTVNINGSLVSASGVGTITIPNTGNSAFVKTQGTFTVNHEKSFEQNLVVESSIGIALKTASNNVTLTIRPSPTTTGNFDLILPNDYGTNGSILANIGGGATTWQQPTPLEWVSYSPSITPVSGFSSISLLFARRRGLGLNGTLMQVTILLSLTRSTTSQASLLVSLPAGTISGWTNAPRPLGICQQGTFGAGFRPSGVALERTGALGEFVAELLMRPSTSTIGSATMLCNFFYVVQI